MANPLGTDDRRRGRFLISSEMLKEAWSLIQNVAVVRCEHLWSRDAFEYYAVSDAFDVLPENVRVPTYQARISTEDGKKVLNWVREPTE